MSESLLLMLVLRVFIIILINKLWDGSTRVVMGCQALITIPLLIPLPDTRYS